MTAKYNLLHILIGIWLLFWIIFEPVNGKTDPKFKFGPLYPPHDRTIITDFDNYAIQYCGLKGSLFNVAHCIFHAYIEVLEERELKYEDYESIISLLLQGKNIEFHQKLISSTSNCESMVVPYVQFSKPKSSKSIMGVKISTKVEDYCKFAYRCINNEPNTLNKSKQSQIQEHLGKWIGTSFKGNEGFGLVLASRLDFQISKLKIRPKEPNELFQIGSKLAAEPPANRESLCVEILNSKELCSIVVPYKLSFNSWTNPPIDPIQNKPFKFNPKTMIDEKVKSIVNIQVNEELPPYCVPQEIFSFKPPPEMYSKEKKIIHFYIDLTQTEKAIINQFLMHFVINYGKIPRVIFDNRSRYAIEGWLSHKNKSPIISVHNSMYSLGRKLHYKDAMSGMLYSNSGSKKETYPYNLPQFKVFSVYSDKARTFDISDTNPLISTCLREGCAYFIGRSATMNPVLVIRASTIISIKNFKQSSASFLSMFLMSFAEKYLFFPGKVEAIDIIVDCRGFSLSNFSTLLRIKPIILYWQDEGIINQYPLRFNNVFIIQQSDIWGTLKDILGRFWLTETVKSVKVISNVSNNPKDSPDLKLLWRYISPHIIETDIGGVRPKLQNGQFYPFRILPGPYKPFKSNLLDAQVTPTLSDWPNPDFNSPKNLYKLLPQNLFSPRAKTLDGNDVVIPIDWKESKKLLDSIPKNLWPDMSTPTPEVNSEDSLENKTGSKLNKDFKTSQSEGEQNDIETSQETQGKIGTSKTIGGGAKSSQDFPHGIHYPKSGKGRDILLQLMLTQKILNNLKQLHSLRLERIRNKRNLEEQCIQLATTHISFFSNLVDRALIGITNRVANIKHSKMAPSQNSQINKKLSIFEAYRDIASTLNLSRAKKMLSAKSLDYLEQIGDKISGLEAKINKVRQEIRSLLSGDPSILEEKALSTWSILLSVFHELGELRKGISDIELKENKINTRLQQMCEQLVSSMGITKSFLDNYSKYDHYSMFESSLLFNMINTIIKGQEYSFENSITGK
ncbi:protein with signal peptide and Sec14d domain [Cryptosporidium sp. chipmunk genotype I]|uniref:protein with signal peptide and Sec14d domain n=1 Tax=Cryptosporidium sp. chipmunk genotype I TaxID=1280935 RepID=UPI00351A4E91|nr:protein with signal peptide and Sec14d domain [Cryptosporidium sp. chipmunk genotype I]